MLLFGWHSNPSINEKLVKSLGKAFNCSLRDAAAIQTMITELE